MNNKAKASEGGDHLKEKIKALIPFLIYVTISTLIGCFLYMTETGGLVLLIAFVLWPIWFVYFIIIMWIPYELGKRCQRRGEFRLPARILIALINSVLYACISPFVDLLTRFVESGKWDFDLFIEFINPFSNLIDWHVSIYAHLFLTFIFFLLGEEIEYHSEKQEDTSV